MHDYMLSTCTALPSPQKEEERDPGNAGPYARKESPYQNHLTQMLTDQAGSQKHLGEVTGLVDWFIGKFPLYPFKLSFLCTTCETCVSNPLSSTGQSSLALAENWFAKRQQMVEAIHYS